MLDAATAPVVVSGLRIWNTFCYAAGLTRRSDAAVVLLDVNHVINRLTWVEAVEVAVALDHNTPSSNLEPAVNRQPDNRRGDS